MQGETGIKVNVKRLKYKIKILLLGTKSINDTKYTQAHITQFAHNQSSNLRDQFQEITKEISLNYFPFFFFFCKNAGL
jgi:hypothetical protein